MGDRVMVSGSKPGILKYVGETDFAKGVWAGVELDEALGKNDGAVAGKRWVDMIFTGKSCTLADIYFLQVNLEPLHRMVELYIC